jgi:hypothetical protein
MDGISFETGGKVIAYQVPRLTERGAERLASGEHLGW